MLQIPDKVLEFWRKDDEDRRARGWSVSQRMGPVEFARIEKLWGFPLPPAYKEFQSKYGSVVFPDFFCAFDYSYQIDDTARHVHPATINSVLDIEGVEARHRYLIDDPDNETEEPFFPPFMLPFAGDPGTNEILLELGSETPRIWFWEEQSDAFGRGDNQILGFVANSIEEFLAALRPWG